MPSIVDSKIPRKVPANTSRPGRSQGGANGLSQRSISLSHGVKAHSRSTFIPKLAVNLSSNRNKPLPSPPIAQLINPSSPLKAQRTLVDAEVAGILSSQEWPIISPENISPRVASSLTSQESPSYAKKNGSPNHLLDNSDGRSLDLPVNMLPEGGCYNEGSLGGPYTSLGAAVSPLANLHAIAAPLNKAQYSPPAQKLVSTSRASQKRPSHSLPIEEDQVPRITAALDPISPCRQARPGSTKWPLLNEIEIYRPPITESPLSIDQILDNEDNNGFEDIRSGSQGASEFETIYKTLSPQHAPSNLKFTWSRASSSFLQNESCRETERSRRLKRISRHTRDSGLGPVLKISHDADSILLSQRVSILHVPAAHDVIIDNEPKRQPSSTPTGRKSRQTKPKMSLNISSRSSMPQQAKIDTTTDAVVRIRPFQPIIPLKNTSSQAEPTVTTSLMRSQSQSSASLNRTQVLFSDEKYSSSTSSNSAFQEESPSKSTHPLSKEPTIPISDSSKSENRIQILSQPVPSRAGRFIRSRNDSLNSKGWETPPTPKGHLQGHLSKAKLSLRRPILRTSRTLPYRESHFEPSASSSTRSCLEGASSPSRMRYAERDSTTEKVTIPLLPASTLASAPQRRKSNAKRSIRTTEDKDSCRKDDSSAHKIANKMKAKRSFRDFFHVHKSKCMGNKPKATEKKGLSQTVHESTLAKRFRYSTNCPRLNLPKTTEKEAILRQAPKTTWVSQAQLQSQEPTGHQKPTSSVPREVPMVTRLDEAIIANNILNRISSLLDDLPNPLRGPEIAKVILNAMDAYKEAKISVTEAKKYARQAELNVERTGIQLRRLQELCEPCLDNGTVLAIREMIKNMDFIRGEE